MHLKWIFTTDLSGQVFLSYCDILVRRGCRLLRGKSGGRVEKSENRFPHVTGSLPQATHQLTCIWSWTAYTQCTFSRTRESFWSPRSRSWGTATMLKTPKWWFHSQNNQETKWSTQVARGRSSFLLSIDFPWMGGS